MTLYAMTFRAMGCQIHAQLEAGVEGHAVLSQLPAKVEAMEARLSRFRPDSELMQLNKRAGEWVKVSTTLLEVIQAAKHAAQLTNGLFNPLVLPAMLANGYDRSFEQIALPLTTAHVPAGDWQGIELRRSAREVRIPPSSALDLGGIAKGWAAEKLADELAQTGACLVNMGGDMVARGAPQGWQGWQVEVSDPFNDAPLVSLWLKDTAIATSGSDFRQWATQAGKTYHHIVNPQTGCPAATNVLMASVVHPHAPTAEAYAKAVILQGAEAGLSWLSQQWHAEGLVVQDDGKVLATANFVLSHNERLSS